jgi:hypothetical protein
MGRITLRQFTFYIDRDIGIEAANDKEAVALTQRLHIAVDRAIAEIVPSASAEPYFAGTQCQRGRHNKVIYDEERGEEL